MALPIPPPPPAGGSTGMVTSDQFDDLIKIQTTALTALVDIRNELVKSASAMAEMRLEALAAAGAAGSGAAGGVAAAGDKPKGGGLGGLLKGAGAFGLGAGLSIAAVLAGAGLAAGGISLLLNTLAEPGLGKAIKENVDQLLAINEGNAKSLQALDLLAVFTMLGTGLAVFGGGAAIAGLSTAITDFFGVADWAETIHDNVIELLSIAEDAGGSLDLLVKGGSVALALGGLGVGLAWFGAGAGIAGLSTALTDYFGVADWATKIKDNVLELLSIASDHGGSLATLADGAVIALALAGLGIGLAVFGVAGALAAALGYFQTADWAKQIKTNVLTLLSIAEGAGGKLETLAKAGTLTLALTGLSIGLAIFGVAGALTAALVHFQTADWALAIKDNVLTLLSIAEDAGGNLATLASGATITLALTGLGIGLAVFGAGQASAALTDALATFANAGWADEIKKNVLTLLSIPSAHGGKLATLADGAVITLALTGLGIGLAVFGAGQASAALTAALADFATEGWADNIKKNVLLLLSIPSEAGGKLETMAAAAVLTLALTGLAVGLAVFGTGTALLAALTSFQDPTWADFIKTNVVTLLSIPDAAGGGLKTMADGAVLVLALTGLSVGLAIFGVGTALLAALTSFQTADWATPIKTNVLTLLSIPEEAGGSLDTMAKAGALTLALAGLGVGLAIFGTGETLMAALLSFQEADWATTIKNNVLTLLSIPSEAGGSLATMAAAGTLTLALAGLATGIAIFGGGQAIAGLSDGLTSMVNAEWATNIKKNVLTLLSIPSTHGGKLDTLADGGTLLLALAGLAAGIAIFGGGQAIAGLADGMTQLINPEWASTIKTNVLTLLSIGEDAGGNLEMLKDGGAVVLALTGLGIGLAVFGVGKSIAAFSDLIADGNFAQDIKDEVTTLLSIVDEGAMEEGQVKKFIAAMTGISAGLLAFTGSKLIDGLAGAATGLLNFLSGNESPVQAVLRLADNVDSLERVGGALQSITTGLGTFSGLKGIGDVDIKEMTENLKESLPDLEKAIMGGHVDTKGWGGVDIKGLASPDIKYQEAAANLNAMMQSVSGALPTMVKGAGGAVQPGAEATAQMIESMTIRTAIIESAVIQGPIAGAITAPAGGGATVNNNTVTVSPSTTNSVSSTSVTEATYGTSDPYTGGISSGRFD